MNQTLRRLGAVASGVLQQQPLIRLRRPRLSGPMKPWQARKSLRPRPIRNNWYDRGASTRPVSSHVQVRMTNKNRGAQREFRIFSAAQILKTVLRCPSFLPDRVLHQTRLLTIASGHGIMRLRRTANFPEAMVNNLVW